MKIEKLILEKYGIYENRELVFRSDAHLHLVVGPNEAGKTSALSAIGDLLFNFPNVSAYAIGYSPNTMRLGATLSFGNGRTIVFRRRKGKINTVVDENDKPLDDDLLDPVLRNIKRDAFEEEYGLTAERLRVGGDKMLAAGGKLAETLAASSAGLSALNRLKSQLQAEADELFTARKVASKAFYATAEDYAAKTKELRDAIVTADALQQAEAACDDTVVRRKSLEEEHSEASRELSRLLRARDTRAKLRELTGIEWELADIPAPPAAAAGKLAQWREALKEEAVLRQAIEDIGNAIAERTAAIAGLNEQPELLASAQEIVSLDRAAGAAEDYRRDLPRREREHHAALSKLEGAARALGLASTDALIEVIPTHLALAGVRETLQQRRNSALKAADLQERLARANGRREELGQQIDRQGHAADPADLKRTFERFRNVPADTAMLQRHTASIRQDLRDIENRLARLSPSPPPLRDLVALPLPDTAAVDAIRQKEQNLAGELTRIDLELGEQTGALDTAERALRQLEQVRALVTRDDLAAARRTREDALDTLRNAKAGERETALRGLAEANTKLDRITDELLANVDDAARKLTLEQERQRASDSLALLRETRKQKHEEQNELTQTWRGLWAGLDIEPATPATMVRWLGEVGHAIANYDALSGDKKDMEELRERLKAQEQPLKAFLAKLDIAPLEEASIKSLFDAAEAALHDMEHRWTERRVQAQDLQNAIREIESIKSDIATLESTQQAQSEDWRAGLAILQCRPDASLAVAGEALRVWDEALDAHRKFGEEDSRLAGVRKRIADFETRVREICLRLAPGLADTDAFDAVEQLKTLLQAARDAARELERLRKEAERLRQQAGQREKDHGDAQAVIAAAAGTLALGDAAQLEAALDRLARRAELSVASEKARHDLVAMTNGMSVEALRAEHAHIDFDTLDGDIARIQQRSAQLLRETNEAAIAARDAERVLAELLKGRNAAAIAQQRQEAAGELLDISRRWLVRAAAARLAGQAIERYRQIAQDPVIARASQLFAHATEGAFERLGTEFDDRDELVFRAVRHNGENVPVAGLSDGTRDQLFLALRLALLEQRSGEPLPFIGDDLLTSFDDARTGQAIEMLAEIGKQRQVILFSHHRHVGEIARNRLGGRLDLVEL